MMKKKTKNKYAFVKQLLVLPLLATLVMGLSNKDVKTEIIHTETTEIQQKVINGKVTNEKGEPLNEVAVIIKGKPVGTISELNGNYEIQLEDENETLIFTLTGFENQEIKTEGKTEINVTLKPGISSKVDKIQIRPNENMNNDVSLTGNTAITSATGSEQTLYVIDGKEVKNTDNIKPDDIQSIDVIKGESGTRLYGEKGKNGVVLITTKGKEKKEPVKIPGNPLVIVDGQEYSSVEAANVKPEEVARMDVIKNPVYTKMYGEKAKDGVILINTKTKYNSSDDKPKPLIVLNGIISENKKIEDIDPETIESVNVLKDGTATEKYGEKGKNGVIEIKLKSESIDTTLKLRRFFAERIKYPVEAQENGVVGKISMAVTFDNNGKVLKIDKSSPNYENLDEVVVTANNPEKKPHVQDNDSELLRNEMIRVINLMSAVDIDDFKGKTINVMFNFQLQD